MPSNAYDEIVVKATDENLTSENWELVLNLCDKVNDESESGARAVVSALLKRLAHRSPTVQLYSLSLAEALSKNCGESLHRELASRSFTQGLEKLITDRNTHEKVKRRGLYLVSLLTGEFEANPQLGLMEELYESLRAKGHNFEQIKEPLPPAMDDDEIRRKEEEELQKVLEMSLRDKGGRSAPTWETSGGSSSSSSRPGPSAASIASPTVTEAPRHSSHRKQETIHVQQPSVTVAQATPPAKGTSSSSSSVKSAPTVDIVTRVRALHPFEPTVAGELGFEKGDIIRVTDRAYEHWWRGQLKGRTGIFPVNYVEPLPDLTVDEIAREAEQEAAVFAQAANIDKLVEMLRAFDHSGESLADNEEIQELYRSSMALRPRIVKLIDKYSQKRAELVAMNENFVKARAVFDQMMEESLARHTGVYETRQQAYHPDSRASRAYNWDAGYEQQQQQPGYGGYGVTSPYQASYPFPGQGQYQAYPPSGDPAYGYNDPRASVYGPPQMSQGQSQAYSPGDHNDPRANAYGPPQMSQGQSQAYPPGDHYAPGAQQPYAPSADTAPAGYPAPNMQSPPPSMAQSQTPASFSQYGASQMAQRQPQAYPPGDYYAQAPNAQSYGPAPDGAPAGYPAPNAQSSPPLMAQPQTSTSYLQAQPQSQPQLQQQQQQQPQSQPQQQPQQQQPQQQQQQQQPQPQVQPQPQPQPQIQLQSQLQPQYQPHAEVSM